MLPRVVLREPGALPGEPIERRRLEARLSVGAEVAVAEIVGLDQQDVRTCRSLARGEPGLSQPDGDDRGSTAAARRAPVVSNCLPPANTAIPADALTRHFVNVTRVSALSL